MLFGPEGKSYQCVVDGTTYKIVRCEHCLQVYAYRMTRQAKGIGIDSIESPGSGVTEAEVRAMNELSRRFSDECDAVPCIECHKYQRNMSEALVRDFKQTQRILGLALILVGVGLFALAWLAQSLYKFRTEDLIPVAIVGSLVGIFGIATLVHWFIQRRAYKPNETPIEERRKLALRFGRSMEDFQAYLKYHGIVWAIPDYLLRKQH